jgi:plastocyanin
MKSRRMMKTIFITFLGIVLCLFFAGCSQKGDPNIAQHPASNSASSKAATPIDPATAASVSGTVHFSGAVPKITKIDMSMDPGCRGENQSESYVVNDGKLANVVVYVKEGLKAPYVRLSFAQPLTIDQKGCKYIPHVAAVMVGDTVRFTNSDPATHNIHPSPTNNPKWNESQMPTSPVITKTFANPEMMMPIQCNQHPWMRMYLSILPNPVFAVTDTNGNFEITGLPPGDYTLAAVHEKMGEQTLQIHVGAKESKTGVAFSFAAQ